MNTIKCKDCKFYDVIQGGKSRKPRHGWCAVRSLYPLRDPPGHPAPSGAQRVDAADALAKPYVVTGEGVVSGCVKVVRK